MINRINQEGGDWNLIGFFDDTKTIGEAVSHYGVKLGGIDELNQWKTPISIVIAIGNPGSIKTVKNKIFNSSISFPTLLDPSFCVSDPDTFVMGKGNIIQGDCGVSCDVSFGDFNVLNGSVVFGHDAKVGSFNTFMPATRISGGVHIGDNNFFGVGSIVLQQIKIGNDVRLGAGSVMMTKPQDGNLYIGIPAAKYKFR